MQSELREPRLNFFSSFSRLINGEKPEWAFDMPEPVTALAAGATAFVALLEDGSVWTFGSPLQQALLARTPSKEAPAGRPHVVEALGGIEVKKVAMCEWLGGALSADGALYVWGGRAGETMSIASLSETDEDVSLIEIDGGVDIADFAIGMGHVVALTAEGDVWSCGDNEHGQLGLSDQVGMFVKDWTKVKHDKERLSNISVEAGGWGSWIIGHRNPNTS